MATLRDYFEEESKRYLTRLTEVLEEGAETADAHELHRVARGLRGVSQMAREEDFYTASLALEGAARRVAEGALTWTDEMMERVRSTVDDLETLAEGQLDDDAARRRADEAAERWRDVGAPDDTTAEDGEEAADPDAEFRAFAAREVAGIADTLDEGVARLKENPEDQEALTAILRRQRALLGSARLEDIPAVAEALRAVEDLTRVIAKLGVAVKHEWFDVFRAARVVLIEARDALQRGEEPAGNNSLARLRHMRAELLERYGEGEAVSTAAPSSAGLVQAQAVTEPPPPHGDPLTTPEEDTMIEADEVVDITELCYSGQAALRAALELRADLEETAGDDLDAREKVEEVFDLIRLGLE
ncbi:MAG: hypothetical protein WEA24_07950 [Gemmatimonadota bacterium]